MMLHKSQGIVLWDKAKEIERHIPIRKRELLSNVRRQFPEIKCQTFGALILGMKRGKIPEAAIPLVTQSEEEIASLINQARNCREESDRLLREAREGDRRKVLNPRVDVIPQGQYPKLKQCKAYPLRGSCNYGGNTDVKWERCEYMKYVDGWTCTAPA